jgi:hypothetical protein
VPTTEHPVVGADYPATGLPPHHPHPLVGGLPALTLAAIGRRIQWDINVAGEAVGAQGRTCNRADVMVKERGKVIWTSKVKNIEHLGF